MISFHIEKNFRKIESTWRFLQNKQISTVYQSADYAKLVCRCFFPYKFILRKTYLFVSFYEDGVPIMILPLFKSWFKKKYVLFGYKAGCGYLDAIYGSDMSLEKMQECFETLCRETDIDCIQTYHVKEESLLGKYIRKTQGTVEESPYTRIFLAQTFDDFNQSLSKNSKQNIRTAYNRLEKKGKNFELTVLDSDKLKRKMRNRLLKLYADRQVMHYKKAGGALYRLFIKYIDIGTKLQTKYEGKCKVFVLKIDGKIAAYFDAIYDKDSIVIPRLAIDEQYNWFSPGIILLNESIKKLYQEGNVKFLDLTHGDERYKIAMGGKVSTCLQSNLKLTLKE